MTTPDLALLEFERERERVSRLTKKGVGMPMAGFLFWLAYAVLLRLFPIEEAVLYSFFATGMVFPLGILFTRLAGGDLFAKSPSLSGLGIQLAALQIFFWPVLILVWNVAPAWSPFAMAVLFGSHFLPYWWLYRSAGYGMLPIINTVSLVALVMITGSPLPEIVPLVTAGAYAIAIAMVARENRLLPQE
ncbi:MAG: hypothetical protein HC882_06940 [Acidobacteria bacterium]|nr:hypothetical protein [Acidobacteriota bacterium]